MRKVWQLPEPGPGRQLLIGVLLCCEASLQYSCWCESTSISAWPCAAKHCCRQYSMRSIALKTTFRLLHSRDMRFQSYRTIVQASPWLEMCDPDLLSSFVQANRTDLLGNRSACLGCAEALRSKMTKCKHCPCRCIQGRMLRKLLRRQGTYSTSSG